MKPSNWHSGRHILNTELTPLIFLVYSSLLRLEGAPMSLSRHLARKLPGVKTRDLGPAEGLAHYILPALCIMAVSDLNA